MTRKIAFLEGWSWFKFNNLGLALGTNFKFCTSVAKGLKFVMEILFRKLRAYKLQTSAVCLCKVLENSSNEDYAGVTFYRSRCCRLFSQIAVLNNFLENFHVGLQVHLKKTPHGYVTGRFSKFGLCFVFH